MGDAGLEIDVACPRCEVRRGTRCASMSHSGYKALARSHDERVQAYLRSKGMSRKAYDDLQRMRQGLLVWGRELPSRWCGHGEDYSRTASYFVLRSNQTGRWDAKAPDGSRLISEARTAAIAKEACQEHYSKSRRGTAYVQGRPSDDDR